MPSWKMLNVACRQRASRGRFCSVSLYIGNISFFAMGCWHSSSCTPLLSLPSPRRDIVGFLSQLSSFIENLAAGTRFAQHLESVGIDVSHVARSLAGLTAGEMMEGVKDTAGKVGGQARRLRTEAARMHKVRRGGGEGGWLELGAFPAQAGASRSRS